MIQKNFCWMNPSGPNGKGAMRRGVSWLCCLACLCLSPPLAAAEAAAEAPRQERDGPLLDPPGGDDYTFHALHAYQQRLLDRYGGYRNMPLDVKAAYFDWEMWRYHLTEFHQVYNRAVFPDRPGERPQSFPARDTSTWNGALLAALSYQYAATQDSQTLSRIAEVVQGLHLFFEVTGQPGLMARAVSRADGIILDELKPNRYVAPDGTEYYYQGDPAKGGYNQITGGYAAMMMYVYPHLPPDIQRMARDDITALVLHVIDHDYRATDRQGHPTPYGDMRPLIGSMSVPFNAQVAYQIIALGYSFPPNDPDQRERIVAQFRRLRGKHHVYYENPWRNLLQPQRVGGSRFVKGMNDRNHVTNAAFFGLALELDHARRHGEEFNRKFVYQLGQTMFWSMDYLHDQRNSLCCFMWAAILRDPHVFEAIVAHKPDTVRVQVERGLVDGVEQLRRFPLDRFVYPGSEVKTDRLQWCDTFKPDDSYWKCNPYLVFQKTGPATNVAYCAMDYLYAYWLLRFYRLDEHPALARGNLTVLAPTPGLAPPASN